jgi:hypothetical protein
VTDDDRRLVLRTAGGLLDGCHPADVHPEYVRALCELTRDLVGLHDFDQTAMAQVLWAIAK